MGHSKKKEQVTYSSRDNTSNLRRYSSKFLFYSICVASFETRVYSKMSSTLNTSTVYANICVITLPQINWNKQDVSVGLRSRTCSFWFESPKSKTFYQTRHFSSGFIRLPFWHWKASENASKFWSDPSTLKTKEKQIIIRVINVCYVSFGSVNGAALIQIFKWVVLWHTSSQEYYAPYCLRYVNL